MIRLFQIELYLRHQEVRTFNQIRAAIKLELLRGSQKKFLPYLAIALCTLLTLSFQRNSATTKLITTVKIENLLSPETIRRKVKTKARISFLL